MDKTTILLLFSLANICTGLDIGIFGERDYQVKAGTSLSFTCHVDQGLAVILNYKLEWIHVSLADPQNLVETVLTSQQTLQDTASPDDYAVNVAYDANNLNISLTVKKVEDATDGKFVCRASPLSGSDAETLNDEIDVVVVSDVDAIRMTFDGEGPITDESPVTVEREEGDYGVTCHASGFSPSAHLHIFLDDEEQVTTSTEVVRDAEASKAAGARRYMAHTTATNLKLTASNSGDKLRCEARASYADDAPTLVASVPLLVIALEPTIECDKNVSARVGDLYVKIECIVEHPNVDIDHYAFEIGETGEVIYPGNVTDSFDEVTVQHEPEHDQTKVILDLYKVEEWHFETIYYLDVFTKSGQRFREKATIIMLESSRCSTLAVSQAAVFVLCFLVSMLLSL